MNNLALLLVCIALFLVAYELGTHHLVPGLEHYFTPYIDRLFSK